MRRSVVIVRKPPVLSIKLPDIAGDERAVAGILGAMMAIGVAAIGMIVIMYVFANIATQIPSTGCATADQNIQDTQNTAWTAFKLVAVGLIVLAAAFILGVLIRSFVGGE